MSDETDASGAGTADGAAMAVDGEEEDDAETGDATVAAVDDQGDAAMDDDVSGGAASASDGRQPEKNAQAGYKEDP